MVDGGSLTWREAADKHHLAMVDELNTRIDSEMKITLGAALEILIQSFLPDDLAAAFTFEPEALCADGALGRVACRLHGRIGISFEPGHMSERSNEAVSYRGYGCPRNIVNAR